MVVKRYEKSYEEFHRKVTLPYEDWKVWDLGRTDKFRWFRSENVFAIEAYRRVRDPSLDPEYRRVG